jgi:hypothetical protein
MFRKGRTVIKSPIKEGEAEFLLAKRAWFYRYWILQLGLKSWTLSEERVVRTITNSMSLGKCQTVILEGSLLMAIN